MFINGKDLTSFLKSMENQIPSEKEIDELLNGNGAKVAQADSLLEEQGITDL